MDERERRQELAAFLRTRRARLSPTEVGLPARSRRRTPGLRREEVAELANIGVSWYTLLEQGQDVYPSRPVLESVAQALRLTPVEERHLFLLAGYTPHAQGETEPEEVRPALQRVVDALTPHPAFVIGRRWDILTWNRAAEWLFHFKEPCPPHSHNAVWRFFQEKEHRIDRDWEAQAQNLVAQFRADYARYPDDDSFQLLLRDLQQASSSFCHWWEQHDVRGLPDGPRSMIHPLLGDLEFGPCDLSNLSGTRSSGESVRSFLLNGFQVGAGVGCLLLTSSSKTGAEKVPQKRSFFDTPSQLVTHSPAHMLDLCQNLCQNQNVKTFGCS